MVAFIHGGAWEGGDKGVFSPTDLARFAARGYATANINYRLASVPLNVHDPILSDDVTAALDYVAVHGNEYHVASAKFAVVGHSNGAHLALLAAYKYNSQRRIKAVASLSGPTNFVDPAFQGVPSVQGILERYLGVTFAAQPAQRTGTSPVSVATATSPPTILLHGRLDALVPYTQAEQLNARLLALPVPTDYRLFPTYNHDLNYVALNHFGDDVWDPTLAWFATYLKLCPNIAAIASLPMQSKSLGTSISPVRKPTRLGVAGASRAVTFTIGLPALAITNESPLAA